MSLKAKKPCKRCEKRPRRHGSYCKRCDRERAKERREREPEEVKAAQRRYHHSAKGKQKRREYRTSEKGKEIARNWAQSESGKASQNAAGRRYRKKLRGLTANLPIEVVRPFVTRMVEVADAEHVSGGVLGAKGKAGGYTELARLTGVPKHVLSDIVRRKRLKSVDIGVADRLAMYGDFTLAELYERAEEWAFLTKSSWPEGYYRRQRRAPKRRRARGDTKKALLKLLAEGPMNQREIADRLGFRNTSALSKCLAPLEQEGRIERFRLPQERRRRYRLTEQGEVGAGNGG